MFFMFVCLSSCILFVHRGHWNQSTQDRKTCLLCRSLSTHKSTKVVDAMMTMPNREAAKGVGSCWTLQVVREELILGCDGINRHSL